MRYWLCAEACFLVCFVVVGNTYSYLRCRVCEYGVVVAHKYFYACFASWLVGYVVQLVFEFVGECLVGVASAVDFCEAKLRVLDTLSVSPVAEDDCLVAPAKACLFFVLFF